MDVQLNERDHRMEFYSTNKKRWAPALLQACALVNVRFIYYTEEHGAWSPQKLSTETAVNRSDSQVQGLWDQQLCILVSCNTAKHPRFIYLNFTYPRAFVSNKTSLFCYWVFANNQPLLLAQKIH